MIMIQEVREQAYGPLFRGHIKRDFVRQERRPLYLLLRLHRQGMYTFLAMRDDKSGKLLAYAGLLHSPGVDSMLLDYLAVEPEYRGAGLGSQFMKELAAACDTGGIIIECDSPAQAKTADERKIRERRIGFYLRNGAVATGARWRFIGIHYELLWLPIHKSLDEIDMGRDIPALYSTAAPQPMRKLVTKLLENEIQK